MRRKLKVIFITLMVLILVPGMVSAAKNELTISNLVILEEKSITDISCGNVTIVLGSADIETDVNGSVIVVFGKANIKGNVSGDVVSALGEINFDGNSTIEGNLVSVGKLEKDNGVSVTGTKVTINFDFISMFESNGINGIFINTLIFCAIFTLVVGLLLITIFTSRFRAMSYSMGKAISRRFILGALVVVSLTIVLAFLIFSLIAPAVYVTFIMIMDIVGSIYLGTLIFRNNYERSGIYLQFFVGHILIYIIKIVPLIFIPSGSYTILMIYGICFLIAEFCLASFSIGTVIDTGFGKKTSFSGSKK